jgi:Spy/CpxP family protein refolding chaperone
MHLMAMSATGSSNAGVPMKKLFTSLLVAGVLAGGATLAFSQAAPDAMHGGMHHMDPARMEQMVNRHLTELKTKLKITPAQEGAWTTFTTAMKPSADQGAKRPDRSELEKLPMPDRIDKMRALRKERMAAMEAAMDKREDAAKALYAVLSPEQQKIADAEHARMMERQHGMRDAGPAAPAAAKS